VAEAKEAVEVTEVAEVAMAVVEVRPMEVDVEAAGMAAVVMVALLPLMQAVVMAHHLLAPGESLLLDPAGSVLTAFTGTGVASEVAAGAMHHTRLRRRGRIRCPQARICLK